MSAVALTRTTEELAACVKVVLILDGYEVSVTYDCSLM